MKKLENFFLLLAPVCFMAVIFFIVMGFAAEGSENEKRCGVVKELSGKTVAANGKETFRAVVDYGDVLVRHSVGYFDYKTGKQVCRSIFLFDDYKKIRSGDYFLLSGASILMIVLCIFLAEACSTLGRIKRISPESGFVNKEDVLDD